MIRKLLKFPILVGLIVVALGASAFAVTDVTPANSLLNPANGALDVVNNAAAQVKIYTNFEESGQRINLPAGSTCYGLALSPANNMLYVSVSAGANSKVRAYALNLTSGLPIDEPNPVIMSGDYWSTYSAAAGMAVGGNDRLFVADKGVGRFLAYNTTTNAYVKFVNSQISGKSNIYGIATTATSGSAYKIYVSRKIDAGEIYVYSYNNDTITYVKTLTGLSLPTYMKVVGDKLYVATCGSNQTALKVYSTVDETLVATINVSESVAAFFGLAGFDVSSDGATLAFTKELGSNQTRVYKLATAGISGTVTATAAAPVRPADGLALSSNAARAALSYSYTGSVEVINLANLYEPDFAIELGQFKADGTTPIAPGAETNENQVVLKYRVSDRDGGSLTPSVIYRQIGGNWITVNGTPFLSGEMAQITLSNLANGPYEWEAGASDGVHDIVYQSFGESVGTDFSVNYGGTGTITSVGTARAGDNAGDGVTLTWQTTPAHSPVYIYYLERPASTVLTAAEFLSAANWTAISNPAIIPNGDLDTFTDPNQVGVGTQKYYTVIPQTRTLIDADLATNVVGKFDLTVGPEPEKLFVSLPIEPADNSLSALIGGQAMEFDIAVIFDINKDAAQGSMRQGGSWSILPGASAALTNLNMGEGFGYVASTARYVTVVGKVRETALARTLTGGSTANWVSTPYPFSFGVASAGLNGTSYDSNVINAAMAVQFDANAEAVGSTNGMAFHYGASEWREGTLQSQSPLILAPGKSYMLIEPGVNSVDWNISR